MLDNLDWKIKKNKFYRKQKTRLPVSLFIVFNKKAGFYGYF